MMNEYPGAPQNTLIFCSAPSDSASKIECTFQQNKLHSQKMGRKHIYLNTCLFGIKVACCQVLIGKYVTYQNNHYLRFRCEKRYFEIPL